jgi:hypothetical protein
MVSSVFGLSTEQLIQQLKEIAARNAFDPEYKKLREELPEGFGF